MKLKDLKNYVGHSVKYVLERDIDKSGRMFVYVLEPRRGKCTETDKNHLCINGDWIYYKEINSIEIITEG